MKLEGPNFFVENWFLLNYPLQINAIKIFMQFFFSFLINFMLFYQFQGLHGTKKELMISWQCEYSTDL
jgi:hypothetical protein